MSAIELDTVRESVYVCSVSLHQSRAVVRQNLLRDTPMISDQLQASLLGRYTIERELGRGGMATVYLAEDMRHRRKVALKVSIPNCPPSSALSVF